MKVIAENKKALFDYKIMEKYRAGMVLTGQEVKSIKLGRINLSGAYVVIRGEESFLIGADVPPYQPKNLNKEYNPSHSRKLLLRKAEIKHLIGFSRQKGLTLVALKVYTDAGKIKLEFGVGKHRKKVDKREKIKEREAKREIQRVLKRG